MKEHAIDTPGNTDETERETPEYSVVCPKCNIRMHLTCRKRRLFYACPNPACTITHNCHQVPEKRGKPYGRPAPDEATRKARIQTHVALDALWKSGKMNRSKTYQWLARTLNINHSRCHVGYFSLATCERAIVECEKKLKKLKG